MYRPLLACALVGSLLLAACGGNSATTQQTTVVGTAAATIQAAATTNGPAASETIVTTGVAATTAPQTTQATTDTGIMTTTAPQNTAAATSITASGAQTTQPATGAAPATNLLRWSNEGISELPSIDPAKPGDSQAVTVISLVFGGLVRFDDQLKVQPDGAESWTTSPDGKVFTFKIRPNLKFADGTPVTAQDFAYSFNRALTPNTQSFAAPFQLSHIVGASDVASGKAKTASGILVVDPQTLEITLDSPLAYFLSLLTYPSTFVTPQKLVDTGTNWTDHAYGTGPFRVKEWKHNQEITLEPNPSYWRGTVGITINMPFIQDSQTAYQLYQTNKLDIMGAGQNGVPSANIPDVKGKPDYQQTAALATRFIGFNNKKAPFDKEQVRRAFALATDRKTIAEQVLGGNAEASSRILPKGMPAADLPIQGLDFDPTKAKSELQAAGVDPASLQVTLTYGQEGENDRVAQALQSIWGKNLGVTVNLQPLELATFSKNLDTTTLTPEQGLQFYLSIWGADYPDPQNFLSQQLQTESPNNNGHYSNTQFDQLTKQADTLGAQNQYDQRMKLYNQAEQIAVNGVGWLPLYNPYTNGLIRPTVKGLKLTGQGLIAPDWTKVTVSP
ncbi:MAG: peptide ABC transporter substrate-binding protein [Herpetosiphonaceae bacterium]|nr:peptide ABC transporter substrate-binding protein [Herpetosiphonaceae bacterium]